MPWIQVKLIDKVLTAAQRKETITRLKDAIVTIQQELEQPVSLVLIEEGMSDVGSDMWHCLSNMSPELV